jgi:transcriptional regulator with XRE-family HTH domain
MTIPQQFARNLRLARERVGLSQEELGIRASMHRTQIGSLERGAHLPRLDTLVKLAGALSICPERLLDGIRWNPGSATAGAFERVTE